MHTILLRREKEVWDKIDRQTKTARRQEQTDMAKITHRRKDRTKKIPLFLSSTTKYSVCTCMIIFFSPPSAVMNSLHHTLTFLSLIKKAIYFSPSLRVFIRTHHTSKMWERGKPSRNWLPAAAKTFENHHSHGPHAVSSSLHCAFLLLGGDLFSCPKKRQSSSSSVSLSFIWCAQVWQKKPVSTVEKNVLASLLFFLPIIVLWSSCMHASPAGTLAWMHRTVRATAPLENDAIRRPTEYVKYQEKTRVTLSQRVQQKRKTLDKKIKNEILHKNKNERWKNSQTDNF